MRIEVLRKTEERNILHTVKRTKPNWIGYILRGNCFLKRVIERGTLGRGVRRAGFEGGCGPVVRQTTE